MVEQPLIRDFAAGTVRDIERNYGVVLNPFNVSLARLVADKRPIWQISNGGNPDFMNLVSRSTQIAIFPYDGNLYVPGSDNLSLDQQRELLAVDEAEVIRKQMGIGGLRLIIGDIAIHAGLILAYFDITLDSKDYSGRLLHGRSYANGFAITDTPTQYSNVAVVSFHGFMGLHVDDCDARYGRPNVLAVRLGVPAQD